MVLDVMHSTLGFIGTGTITEAIVEGLSKTDFRNTKVVLSPRNEELACRLAARHDNVSVARDNQQVLDDAHMVFLAIRPQIAEEVVRDLIFGQHHRVVSLVAATQIETLRGWIAQDVSLCRAIPLPFVADLQGVTAIHPPDAFAAKVFSALGTVVEVERANEYDLLAAASALMGLHFGLLDGISAWLHGKGLERTSADSYLRQLSFGLAHTAKSTPAVDFGSLARDHSTKGGLNEQVLADFTSGGGMTLVEDALERVMTRITATSDARR